MVDHQQRDACGTHRQPLSEEGLDRAVDLEPASTGMNIVPHARTSKDTDETVDAPSESANGEQADADHGRSIGPSRCRTVT